MENAGISLPFVCHSGKLSPGGKSVFTGSNVGEGLNTTKVHSWLLCAQAALTRAGELVFQHLTHSSQDTCGRSRRAFQTHQVETLGKQGWGPGAPVDRNSCYSGIQLQFTAIRQNQPKKKELEQSLTKTSHKFLQILAKYACTGYTKCPPQPLVTTHVHLSLLKAQDSWGLGTNALSTQQWAEPQTPKREAGVQCTVQYLYGQCKLEATQGKPPETYIPTCDTGPPYRAGLLRKLSWAQGPNGILEFEFQTCSGLRCPGPHHTSL